MPSRAGCLPGSKGASPPGVTVGTLGTGPKAWGEVVAFRKRQRPVSWLRSREACGRLVQQATLLLRSAIPFRVGRRRLRPVLKHGPRSLTCMRVVGLSKPEGAVKAKLCFVSARDEGVKTCNPATSNQPRLLGVGRAYTLGPERW